MDKRLVTLRSFFPSTGEQFRETAWLTFGCLKRFLTASRNNVKKALARVRMAIEWRNNNEVWDILQPWSINAHFIQHTAKPGHLHVLRKPNTYGHAGVVYRPGVVCRGNHEGQLRLLIYTMERACVVAGENKIVLIVDASAATLRNMPSTRLIREAVTILTEKYPERLEKALILNASLGLRVLLSIVLNMIPKLPGRKVRFLAKGDSEIFNRSASTFGYDHDEYFNNFTPPQPLPMSPHRMPFE